MELFTSKDFKVFTLTGFEQRLNALRDQIRPKLSRIGEELVPRISELVDRPLYVHVAKHARRTVNAPDDTWAAVGSGRRGYKKDVHFKVAVSLNCVRLLFEVGPEYYAKAEWARKLKQDLRYIAETFGEGEGLAWFKDEHDENPEVDLAECSRQDLGRLGQELTRRKHGQFVIGRRVDRAQVIRMTPVKFKRIAMRTFRSAAPLFNLHEPRIVGSV